jgi:diguanylate cyclase (GGDEF)-like protein
MAANDDHQRSHRIPSGFATCLSEVALGERLEEEINRAGRHGTPLSCLLVDIENLGELAQAHGPDLSEQTLGYVGSALRRELRRFDRVGRPSASELLVVLPGADGARGEIVARRALGRLRAIKIEVERVRLPLRISMGIAPWRGALTGEELLEQARIAARRTPGPNSSSGPQSVVPTAFDYAPSERQHPGPSPGPFR